MEKLYKENQIGKANIFDRYFYFVLQQTRISIMLEKSTTTFFKWLVNFL